MEKKVKKRLHMIPEKVNLALYALFREWTSGEKTPYIRISVFILVTQDSDQTLLIEGISLGKKSQSYVHTKFRISYTLSISYFIGIIFLPPQIERTRFIYLFISH